MLPILIFTAAGVSAGAIDKRNRRSGGPLLGGAIGFALGVVLELAVRKP